MSNYRYNYQYTLTELCSMLRGVYLLSGICGLQRVLNLRSGVVSKSIGTAQANHLGSTGL